MRVLKKEERGRRRGKTAWKSEAEGMALLHGNESGEGSPDRCSEELERVLLYGLYSGTAVRRLLTARRISLPLAGALIACVLVRFI